MARAWRVEPQEDEAGAEIKVQQSPEARRARSVLLTIEMLTDQISYAICTQLDAELPTMHTRGISLTYSDITYWHVGIIMILIDTVLYLR